MAEPYEKDRNAETWEDFPATMKHYYKQTKNPVMKNFKFRFLTQHVDETYTSFCKGQEEAIYCHFKCDHKDCTAEDIAVTDQILIKLRNADIRQGCVA